MASCAPSAHPPSRRRAFLGPQLISFTSAIFGLGNAAKINALYPEGNYKDLWWRLADEVGDWSFVCPARRTARIHEKHASQPTFAYFFTMPNRNSSSICIGVCHGLELIYVLNHKEELKTQAELQLAESMTAYWANFGGSGNPNIGDASKALREWPAFKLDAQKYLNLTADIGVIDDLREERCNFWDSVEATPLAERNADYPMSLEGLRRAAADARAGRLPLPAPAQA